MNDGREALLRAFYAAIDAKDWEAATVHLMPACRWHILANDVVGAASVVGPQAVGDWFRSALGPVDTQRVIERIEPRGDGVAVFTTATVTAEGASTVSEWIDVFTFEGNRISEHVSVRTARLPERTRRSIGIVGDVVGSARARGARASLVAVAHDAR